MKEGEDWISMVCAFTFACSAYHIFSCGNFLNAHLREFLKLISYGISFCLFFPCLEMLMRCILFLIGSISPLMV